jgi:hypothetical protein
MVKLMVLTSPVVPPPRPTHQSIAEEDDPVLRITGSFAGYSIKLIIILTNSDVHTGSYVFASDKNYSGSIITNNPNLDTYYAGPNAPLAPPQLFGSGTITITEISKKHVKGNFDFITATNGATGMFKNISNGTFDINRD